MRYKAMWVNRGLTSLVKKGHWWAMPIPINSCNVSLLKFLLMSDVWLIEESPIITKPDNFISETRNERIQLSNHKDIVINIADKNIINNTTWYMQELSRQLSDTATYTEICNCNQNDIIKISISNLNKLRQKYERLHVDKSIITRMTS